MTGGQKHSANFQRLIERRRKFIDGLDANRGEINLDIFEDFYPDRAHFVYELLQNAEDAGATEVSFTLTPDRLVCEHDGRVFTLEDVKSITGLHDSTKAQAQDKIGKFGVGFKSVFVYTAAPSIYSGDFAFRIVQLILPEPIAPAASLAQRTRFEFPFDNAKKPKTDAHAEIAAGLKELDEKTLLFLSSLQSVNWRIGAETTGAVRRCKHSDFHFEVLKELGGKTAASSHFLKFDEAVHGLEEQRVAVAFPLDFLPGVPRFQQGKPLAEQVKIIPAEPGSVAVFFPAVKESSGLRFHLHGPFVPELSRASIKETKANLPLFEQLAALAGQALHRIKELGLLTPDFLSVLPNPQDQIPPRYQGIRTAIADEMKAHPLTPTHARGHAPANRLIQARASLKSLLSEEDIEFLVDYDDDPPLWAIGATQRNSRIDNFLSGLGIREWGLEEFLEALCGKVDEDAFFRTEPDEEFLSWLQGKPSLWMQEFYALLHAEAKDEAHRLKSLRIVSLADGTLSKGDRAFFSGDSTGKGVVVADKAVYTSGTSKNQQENAKNLLTLVGVREIGEAEEVEIILKARYTKEAELPDDATYAEDLKRFVALVEKQPDKAKLFGAFYIFQGEDEKWYRPEDIYLDQPYADTNLSSYYGALSPEARLEALHRSYRNCGVEVDRLGKFARAAGARVGLRLSETTCEKNPEWNYLLMVAGSRASTYISRDYFIPHLIELLKTPSLGLSRLVWRTLTNFPSYPNYLQATYQMNRSNGARTAASRLVHALRAASWIPQGDGVFVRPTDASRELLPKGFPFDSGYAWLKAVQFGETAIRASAQALQKEAAAKSLGFSDAAAAERAKRFNELPEAEQERILATLDASNKAPIPDRPLANPERRSKNVREQALKAPDKESEVRERSVSIGREEVKEQADTYLREHYRNADGEMTCQICKGPLPFKLDDGREYFEVVEFLPELRKRHPQNYLALCPNHSAMYRFVNGSKETTRDEFQAIEGNELPVVLAEKDVTVYFSKTHIVDLKAVLEAEESLPPAPEGAVNGALAQGIR
ncbi:TPA: hypothetical protein VDB83_000524 [Burkholderia cenocepacia]|uniref:sacsin N-terminal ATP-binding-like domain-containing protein n=1 Tax=Burkholderia cenocepacia TaxID=95486 RepID=UPI001B93EBEB|nr:hypothetical protein [Burkholderia cenocepacia]MBR8098242.1 hypothetical protein [Burkholderia cenocepacia]HEP6426260.1 hypothetical protein [Burkholderia cenocepacia]